MTINGEIPGPVIEFTEGDYAVLRISDKMDLSSSIHWRGKLVPPHMDGVPGISYPPIPPGGTYTYRFPIRRVGTYSYHLQRGENLIGVLPRVTRDFSYRKQIRAKNM